MESFDECKRRLDALRRDNYRKVNELLKDEGKGPLALAASIDEKPHHDVAARLWRDLQHVGEPIGGGQ